MKNLKHCLLGIALCLPAFANAADQPMGATPAAAGCASAADAARVAAAYAAKPAPMPFVAAMQLKLPESTIAAALPAGMSVGVDGSNFRAIWDSLAAWQDEAVFLVMKGGNVFEIHSKVAKGEPSTKSKFFNLGAAAFSGHLRPDLVASIHGLQLPGREGFVRAFFFYDEQGANLFSVIPGGEGQEPSARQLADFEATWKLVKSLPQRCATPAG
jgi:putative heme iron utilization protein